VPFQIANDATYATDLGNDDADLVMTSEVAIDTSDNTGHVATTAESTMADSDSIVIELYPGIKNNIPLEMEYFFESPNMHKSNLKTTMFYSYEMKTSGRKYLIANMCGNVAHFFDLVSNEEVDYQINLSRFVSTLTISQQRQFAKILHNFKNVYLNPKDNLLSPVCQIPKELSDIRRMYTEGENSIENHLPIPNCAMIEDHSYVSIVDCIADVLLRNTTSITSVDGWRTGLTTDTSKNKNDIFHCVRILETLTDADNRIAENKIPDDVTVIPIFITLWSDDFDPNRSIKANRQSVWIKTCTIFFRSSSGEYIDRTYPVAMATKGSNHDVVESRIAADIKTLNSGNLVEYFSTVHGKAVLVHADIYCVMNDQPERRGNLKLSNGNALAHGRFGLTLDCRQKQNVIL
jgi:hypothetical protein